jgi:hypothetical protein
MTAAVRAPAWVADPDQHPGRPVPVVTVVLARAFPKEPISRWQLIRARCGGGRRDPAGDLS